MWDNREYKMYFSDGCIRDFEQIMLTSGECESLLPMLFIGETSGQTVYYDCSGFQPLSRYQIDNTDDALFILEQVLIIVSGVTDYLLTPSRITLSKDTVFYHPDTGEIKIAYVPSDTESGNLRLNILLFISQLKKEITDGKGSYLDRFANVVHRNNYQIKELANRLGLIRRELFSKDI